MSVLISYPETHIALVTLSNSRRRNALGPSEFLELAQAWQTLEQSPGLRCVVITGEGDLAFCSGASLDADFGEIPDIDDLVDRALLKTRFFPLPLIAAINGHCVAGGFELMLSSDIRVASCTARFGLPEVRWGIMPSGGGAMKLIEQIGYAPAMQLLLTAELIDASEALNLKLVNQVVSAAEVLATALSIARKIAAHSPIAVRHTKQASSGAKAKQWRLGEAEERELARSVRANGDGSLGRDAFLHKKTPVYPDTQPPPPEVTD